jgi:hypothetical protein
VADDPFFVPGRRLWSRDNCGDFYEGKHVTIPRNTEGYFVGYFDRDDGAYGISRMARIDIPTSPGQKSLTCRAAEIDVFWRPTPPRTVWETVLAYEDG